MKCYVDAAGAVLILALASCSDGEADARFGPSPPEPAVGGAITVPPQASAGGATAAGAGGTPGSGGAGTGGVPIVAAGGASPYPYDPNVTFPWPETQPTARQCQAGHYVGTYTCDVTYGDAGGPTFPLTGPVDLVLAEAQDGEFLVVSGGSLKTAAGLIYAEAALAGQLSCNTGTFTGTLQNGTLSIPPFPPGGTFGGNLSANFVRTGPKLDGTWALVGGGPFAGYGCTGAWTATIQP